MSAPRYLIDTSVWARASIDEVGERLESLYLAGRAWTCKVVDLELVYSARQRDVSQVLEQRKVLPEAPLTPEVTERALEVAGLLATKGWHRGGKPTDLLVAAAAELRGLCVLHYDADFERIAKVTGQPMEWIAAAGTLDH